MKHKKDELEAKCEEYLNGWKRAQADYQNLKRESEEGARRAAEFSKFALAKELLPIIDSFEAAAKHTDEVGFLQIKKQFDSLLASLGVTKIEALGQKFDPNLHEALGATESDKAEDEILEEAQAGYKIGERVLRPAKVIISKQRSEDPNASE